MKAVIYNGKSHPDKLVFCDIDKPVPDDNVNLSVYERSKSTNSNDDFFFGISDVPGKG